MLILPKAFRNSRNLSHWLNRRWRGPRRRKWSRSRFFLKVSKRKAAHGLRRSDQRTRATRYSFARSSKALTSRDEWYFCDLGPLRTERKFGILRIRWRNWLEWAWRPSMEWSGGGLREASRLYHFFVYEAPRSRSVRRIELSSQVLRCLWIKGIYLLKQGLSTGGKDLAWRNYQPGWFDRFTLSMERHIENLKPSMLLNRWGRRLWGRSRRTLASSWLTSWCMSPTSTRFTLTRLLFICGCNLGGYGLREEWRWNFLIQEGIRSQSLVL